MYRYISKNINLYEISNEGTKLSTHAQANFARGELAAALRRGPYQVNVLLGGYDEGKGGSLYTMDYLGSLHKVNHGAQGYAQYFCCPDGRILVQQCVEPVESESSSQWLVSSYQKESWFLAPSL